MNGKFWNGPSYLNIFRRQRFESIFGRLPTRRARTARRPSAGKRFTPLTAERLEDRSLLASVGYQLHVVAPDAPATGPDLTSVKVGDSYDVVVTVQDVRENPGAYPGVFAGYLDINYDSSKTHVRVAEMQRISISQIAGASGSFTLSFGGQTTAPITFHSSATALAGSVQSALAALSAIGEGNVAVAPDITSNDGLLVLQVRFPGKFYDQDVPNMTVASQGLSGPGGPTISITADGDLQSGVSDYAFREAWRSRIAPVSFSNGVAAGNLPNQIDDVGAFGSLLPVGTGAHELVRARFIATAAGTVTFAPDLANISFPMHYTLLYNSITPVGAADVDLGTSKTLTIGAGTLPPSPPMVSAADTASVLAGSANNVIDVLANDTTNPAAGQSKSLISVTQAGHGTVTFSPNNVAFYTPNADFVGTDAFACVVRNLTAGADSATSTATVTVTVAAPITAVADSATMNAGGASATIDVLANDTTTPAVGQAKSVVSITHPEHGSAAIVSNRVVYAPASGFFGTDTFSYTARNTTAGAESRTSTASVTITVNPPAGPLMRYQVRIVPVGGALFMPDPQNPHALVPTPDLTTLKVGDSYDLAVTVQTTDPNSLGVFAAYLDLGYDSSKAQVQVGEIQNIHLAGSGSFLLTFGADTTQPIASGGDAAAVSHAIQSALAALPSIGEGNVEVHWFAPDSYRVRFVGKLSNQDVPNMTVAAGSTSAATISYEGDLQGGMSAYAFQEAFRSWGVPAETTLASSTAYYLSGLNVGSQPNLLDDLGAFTNYVFPPGTPGLPSDAEIAAGITVAPSRELVRARFKATGEGTLTFTPDLSDIQHPFHDTLVFGLDSALAPNQIDLGSARSVTVTGGESIYTANPDTASVVEDVTGALIDVLANDTIAPPTGPTKSLVAVTQPAHGSVTLTAAGILYTPAENFVGTDTFTYSAQAAAAGTAGGSSGTAATATVTVTVHPVNDAPSFTKGADQDTNDEAGDVVIHGWATEISPGPPDEAAQVVAFDVTTDNGALFTAGPAIDSAGNLSFTPKPNFEGVAHVTVVPHDSGGTEHGGVDTGTTQTFVVYVSKLHPLHNSADPLDATGDTAVTSIDAMTCINYLNSLGPRRVSDDSLPEGEYLDVNADGLLNPADPLKVIDFLNVFGPKSAAAAAAEGESSASRAVATDLALTAIGPAAPHPRPVSSDLSSMAALLATDVDPMGRRRRA